MPSARIRTAFLFLIAVLLFSLAVARPASAQCLAGLPEVQGISLESGNAFQADYSSQMTPRSAMTTAWLPEQHGVRSVARDSQGRVRVDTFLGKYKTKTPDGVTSDVERHYISICDPVAKKSIQLDTIPKTATIREFFSSLVIPAAKENEAQQSFCTRYFNSRRHFQEIQSEDLGNRLIEGFNAHGVRTIVMTQSSRNGVLKAVQSYTEEWCSDELGAVLLKAFGREADAGSGYRRETGFANIVKSEPDSSLFEIPNDYTIVESAERNRPVLGRPLLRPTPAPSDSKPQ